MTGEADPDPRAAAALVQAGARTAVITLGREGAILRGGADVPGVRADVISTIGAGDGADRRRARPGARRVLAGGGGGAARRRRSGGARLRWAASYESPQARLEERRGGCARSATGSGWLISTPGAASTDREWSYQ